MASSYLAISLLKQSTLPEKQYLSKGNIYNGRRNMTKVDLIDMIISDKDKSKIYTSQDDNLSQKEINNILKSKSRLYVVRIFHCML